MHHHGAAVGVAQHELALVGVARKAACPIHIALDGHVVGVGQAAGAQHLAADDHHVGAVGQDHHVAFFQLHVLEAAVGVDRDVAVGLDVLGLGHELADQGRLGRRQLGRGVGRRRRGQNLFLQVVELVGDQLLLLQGHGLALDVDPLGFHLGAFERDLGHQLAELGPAGHHIDQGAIHRALDVDRNGLQDAAGGKVDVVAVLQHDARKIVHREVGSARRAVAVTVDHHPGDHLLDPGQGHEVRAGHRARMRRRFEGVGIEDRSGDADQGAARPDEHHVAILEAERRDPTADQEVIEVIGGHHLSVATDGDVAEGAAHAVDAAGLAQEVQDVVVRAAHVAARPQDVPADEDPDAAGVADGGVDADGAGEHLADRRADDLLQRVGGNAADLHGADADDEDIAGRIDRHDPAVVHGAVHVDDDLVARLDHVIGPLGRPGAGEGAGEQLLAVDIDRGAVGQDDARGRRRIGVGRGGLAHRRRAGRGARQGIG